MQVVILLGGMAIRLRPITKNIPKAMIMINGRPFLEHQMELLKKNGLKNFVFCVGYKWNLIREYFGDGNKNNIEIKYSYDGKYLLGTAGAVRKAIKVLDEDFIILYGDTYLQIDYRSLIDYYYKNKSGYSGLMSVYKNDNKLDKRNVIYKNGKIIIYDKGVDQNQRYSTYGEYLTLRTGDILMPKISSAEPLAGECKHFLSALESRANPTSDGHEALKVLKVLDAAQKSLEAGGAPVTL